MGAAKATTARAKANTARAKPRSRRSAPLVRVSDTASLSNLQHKIDRCRGPVWTKHGNYPGLIAEHNYCGGAHRLGRHHRGELVRVTGPGVRDGVYRVVAKKTVSKGASFAVLRGMGSVVLQTCKANSLLLTGLVRVR